MLGKISGKIKTKLGVSVNAWEENSWTPYRFITFISSSRGQQKLLFFGKKIGFGILRRITGKDFTPNNNYKKWLQTYYPSNSELTLQKAQSEKFVNRPLFSVIMPTFNPKLGFLKEAVNSVCSQSYSNWELCISDDNSSSKEVLSYLKELSNHPQISVCFNSENGHISVNTNRAISQAKGEYMLFMDHDDQLSPEALFQNARAINKLPETDILYSDEDKIDLNGKHSNPYFKPDWSPETLLSRNYICHLLVVKSVLVHKAGGFRKGFEGAQDYDFLLRITELSSNIQHISKVLYHWRMHEGSTALNEDSKSYYKSAGVNALNEALKRRKINAQAIVKTNLPGFYSINFPSEPTDKVSIIIPSKNLADVTNTCISSIFDKTNFKNYEVILMNNNSNEDSFFELVKYWSDKEPERFKCISDNGNFNFSRLMNVSVANASGNYILLLNNDTEVLHPNWLDLLHGWAKLPGVGAVGAKLLFPDDTIQHAGVVMGLNGIAGHFLNCQYKDSSVFWHTLNGSTNYSAVTAACLMVSKKNFELVNGFDENLAVEFNDVDFCLKLREEKLRNVYIPEVELYHYESISRGHPHKTKESYQRHIREITLFKNKWNKEINFDPYYNTHLSRIHSDAKLRVKEEVIL